MGEKAAALPKLEVEGIVFPPVVSPPASAKTFFLGGAGVRGLEIGGRFIAFTAIGVYLEDEAVRSLSGKWSGKHADELAESLDFFRDIFAGPFEKFTRVTMILPLTGQQYSEKVAENCVAQWKAAGIYTEAEGVAIEKFKEAFQAESFGHGSSILFTHSPSGSLTIAFSKDGSVPEAGDVVIENRALCEALLESIIGERGVSPVAKRSLAVRVSELLKESQIIIEDKVGNPLSYRAAALPKLEVEGIVFPPAVSPPGSAKTLFLGGAGSRGLDIGGRFITFTAIGVYLEDEAVRSLSGRWRGKNADELAASLDFFHDVLTGPFEKFTRVTMIQPLTGQQYSEKVAENCLAAWKAAGIYTEAEGAAIEKFREAFKAESFGPGSSILFTHFPSGSLTITFSKDGSVPEAGGVVIENRALCEAVLESIIGKHGVSPAAKRSLAVRVSELLKESQDAQEKAGIPVAVSA